MPRIILIPLWSLPQVNKVKQINVDKDCEYIVALMFQCECSAERLVSQHLGPNCKVLPFGQISQLVSQLDVSEKVLALLSKIKFIEGSKYASIYKLQANMLALNVHSMVFKLMLLDALVNKFTPAGVVLFGVYGERFSFPERTDVKTLLYDEFAIVQLVRFYLQEANVPITFVSMQGAFKVKAAHLLRRLLLNTYKFVIIVIRYFFAASRGVMDITADSSNVAIVIRAQSEYWTVKPLIASLQREGMNPVILQDDLIKNPSAKQTLDTEKVDYISMHFGVNLVQLLFVWVRATFVFYFSARYLKKELKVSCSDDLIESTLLDRRVLPIWMASTLHAQPEIQLFSLELMNLSKKYDFKYIVTMDMVDQWCAVVGEVGQDLDIPTLIIQNTVLDEILYPRPVCTDVMAVSGEKIKAVLYKSGATNEQICDFGLPLYDDLYRRYEQHRGSLSTEIKIVLATQPFVQSLDYNYAIISDLVAIAAELPVDVVIILKPHPREDTGYYSALVGDIVLPENVVIVKSESNNILDLGADCDLFISRTSTAIQSFILLGRICISYLKDYPVDICERLDYLEHNASIKCLDRESLRHTINDCVVNFEEAYQTFLAYREDYISRAIGPFDGLSALRITKFIAT